MISRSALQPAMDIDLADPWEAMGWCNRLQCSYEELRSAIAQVGNSAYLVQAYFASRVSAPA